jgi:hypothetical protein
MQRLLQSNTEECKAILTATSLPHFGHNFSRIPVSPPTAGVIRTKLAINKPGDEYEQEADRIAEQVMRMPDLQLQNACACGGACPRCQTEQPGREHESLQTKRVQAGDTGQMAAQPSVHKVIAAPGQPLNSGTRGFMESRLGHDFSQVRVHTDTNAAQMNDALCAKAFTYGSDIYFNRGEYSTVSTEGKRLLTHELVHVAQQRHGSPLDASRTAMPAGQTARLSMIQRYPVVEDVIHQPLIDQFRREMGYPPGGIDPATGQQVGPTDPELKYGGILHQWMQNRRQRGGTTAVSQQPPAQPPATP